MREILFRGKSVNGTGWVEGSLVVTTMEPADDTPIKHYHIEDMTIGVFPNEFQSGVSETVDPDTVGQFAGKKDKNGKRVFEHDILQTFTVWADGTVEKGGIGIVQWWEHDQCYVLATKEGYHIDDFGNLGRPEYYEVIGNIHDNPELLGGADNAIQ